MYRFKYKNCQLSFIVVFLIFIFVSILITYPLLFHLGNYSTGIGDELLIAWIHAWVTHSLFTNPFSLFNANIIYPYYNTLAYSDLFLTGSLLIAPFVYLIGQPIAANNITLIYSLTFLGFSIFLLSYYLTKNILVSILTGLLVVFSPATLSYSVHLQMLEIYWVPLAILLFLTFLNTNKTKYFILSLLCFLLQIYNSYLPTYFILFSFIIILLFKLIDAKMEFLQLFSKKNILLVLLTFLLIIPIIIPYFEVSQEFHYTRDLRDAIHFALQPEDLLYPGTNTRLQNFLLMAISTNHYSQNNEFKPGYLGIVFTLLVIFAFVYTIKFRKKNSLHEKSFLIIAILGLLLSFGPFLHVNRHTIHHPFPIPLPYALFYYIMPGFQGFRNSQRWEMLFIIGSAILIGLTLNKIVTTISTKKRIIIYSLILLGIIGEFSPMHFVSIPQKKDFPKIYSWMNSNKQNSTFIILPIYNWNMQPNVQQELYREYFSTIEFRKMVNGYSGFSPPPWQDFISSMYTTFPKKVSIDKLHSMGVEYIIVDKIYFDKEYKAHTEKFDGNMILTKLKNNKSVIFIKTIDNYSVFTIDEKK